MDSACDEVVLEAEANAWAVADLLRTYAGRVVVASPYKTKLIAEAQIKNESRCPGLGAPLGSTLYL